MTVVVSIVPWFVSNPIVPGPNRPPMGAVAQDTPSTFGFVMSCVLIASALKIVSEPRSVTFTRFSRSKPSDMLEM